MSQTIYYYHALIRLIGVSLDTNLNWHSFAVFTCEIVAEHGVALLR